MLRRAAEGATISWLVVTQAHEPLWPAELIERKSREVDAVAAAYGVETTVRLGFPTTRLDTVPRAELIGALRDAFDELRPEVVYLTHPGDVHTDHADVFLAATAVLRSFRTAASGLRRILCYETLSSTDAAPVTAARAFLPEVFSDITPYLERKLEIMALYESESQDDPLPRGPSAIRAQARLRGATVGVQYAEAFKLVRELL
jgi:LmbE family N-acetylglucosaminyl deacetylase